MRIAVDAMGGDKAPGEIIRGVLEAAERFDDVEFLLAGIPERISEFLPGASVPSIEVVACTQVVAMDESPVEAIRRKKDSSLRRVFELVASGEAQAVVSAGNTGATVAAASMLVGPLDGCKRPGIAVTLPSRGGHTVVIDAGANLSPKPLHLLHYGLMAQIFAREVLGAENPSVGLLSVGEEREKGTDLVRAAHDLFARHVPGFTGNCEGRDVFNGSVDVVVCDGFTGNVILKATEGYASYLVSTLVENIARAVPANHKKLKSFIIDFVAQNDYREHGGAPLLGMSAPTIICHGSSNATAISNAISVAHEFAKHDVNARIVEALGRLEISNHTGDAK